MTFFIIVNLTIFIFILVTVIIYFINSSINESEFKINYKAAKIYFDKLFGIYLIPSSDFIISTNTIAKVRRTIKNEYGLEAFNACYEEYIGKYGESSKLNSFVENLISYKFLTAEIKKDKNDILYLMCLYKMTNKMTISFAIKHLNSKSSYVRYNALQVIGNSKIIDEIMKALLIINEEKEYFNNKIVIDFILSCHVQQDVIETALIYNFHLFNAKLVQAVIEYFIIKKSGSDNIKNLMIKTLNKTEEMEIITSVTKYFGEVKVNKAAQSIEDNLESNYWEVRSISAKVAKNYPSKSMIEKLKIVSNDENWFVKENAQKSLNFIGE